MTSTYLLWVAKPCNRTTIHHDCHLTSNTEYRQKGKQTYTTDIVRERERGMEPQYLKAQWRYGGPSVWSMQHSSYWVTRLCVSVNYLVTRELYNNICLSATQQVGVRCMDMSLSNGTEVWCYGKPCIYWGMQVGRNLWLVFWHFCSLLCCGALDFCILVPLVDTDSVIWTTIYFVTVLFLTQLPPDR